MPSAADRIEFAPPPTPGLIRAFGLAVAAHLVLLAALTWGVSWRQQSQELSAEAELWASVPQQAAPRPVETAPPPPPPPEPVKRVEPAPPPPAPREADITLEQQKKRQAEARREQQQRELALREQQRKEAEKKATEKKAADARRQQDAERARQAAEDARLKALREENLRRIAGLAGATGGASATGNAQQSAGPSDSYAGRIRARIKPNIVFTDDVAGNPTAEVEVRAAPDGTIVGRKVVKSSGVRSWDEAVLKAIDKAAVLPRDVDGRVHSPLTLVFRLRD